MSRKTGCRFSETAHAQTKKMGRMTVPRGVVVLPDNWRYDGSSHQIRRRSKRSSQGRRRAHSRQGPLYRRPFATACAARADAALAACACEIHHQRRQGPRDAGRVADSDRGRGRRSRRSAVPVQPGNRSVHRPAIPDPRQGRGAPCRRRRGLRGRRYHRPGPRRDRGDRRQMDAAAGGGRPCQRRQAGCAAGLARQARQRAVRCADRRQEGG